LTTVATYAAGILGTGSYLPHDEITNAQVAERSGVTTEWIEHKTQIRTRRYAAPDEATSDLAAHAATEALADAGCAADDIDYLIVSTSTGDSPQPPTSHLVQHRIGANSAACLDINVVCSGFVYGLALAHSLVVSRGDVRVLVIAAEVYSRFLDFTDHRIAVLLGDGAGAAVVGPVPPGNGVIDCALTGHGDAHALIRVEGGGSRLPTSHDTVDAGQHYVRMNGRGVRDFVMAAVPPAVHRTVAGAGLRLADVDHFVPHQANGVLLGQLVDAAGLAGARTHRTLEKYGNIGSASVPVALDDGNKAGAFDTGDVVLLAGFGGGMSIGTGLLRWGVAA
jgi:3-oxoacyl-[acyl-carrier-protein] synthase-3